MEKTKILMVCLGNICRSPLAEGVLRSKLNSDNFLVDSAGTSNYHIGSPPDTRSVEVARKNGIDISDLKGRQFTLQDFDDFDYIFVMDKSNYKNVLALASNENQKKKVSLLRDELGEFSGVELADPYYGDKSHFALCFSQIDKACSVIAEKIQKKYD